MYVIQTCLCLVFFSSLHSPSLLPPRRFLPLDGSGDPRFQSAVWPASAQPSHMTMQCDSFARCRTMALIFKPLVKTLKREDPGTEVHKPDAGGHRYDPSPLSSSTADTPPLISVSHTQAWESACLCKLSQCCCTLYPCCELLLKGLNTTLPSLHHHPQE